MTNLQISIDRCAVVMYDYIKKRRIVRVFQYTVEMSLRLIVQNVGCTIIYFIVCVCVHACEIREKMPFRQFLFLRACACTQI